MKTTLTKLPNGALRLTMTELTPEEWDNFGKLKPGRRLSEMENEFVNAQLKADLSFRNLERSGKPN